jgi:hypothetical protein
MEHYPSRPKNTRHIPITNNNHPPHRILSQTTTPVSSLTLVGYTTSTTPRYTPTTPNNLTTAYPHTLNTPRPVDKYTTHSCYWYANNDGDLNNPHSVSPTIHTDHAQCPYLHCRQPNMGHNSSRPPHLLGWLTHTTHPHTTHQK